MRPVITWQSLSSGEIYINLSPWRSLLSTVFRALSPGTGQGTTITQQLVVRPFASPV